MYDITGRLIKHLILDQSAAVTRYNVYEYGTNDKIIKETSYDAADAPVSHTDYDYDANALLVKNWNYYPTITLFNYGVPEYESGTSNYDIMDFLSFVYM